MARMPQIISKGFCKSEDGSMTSLSLGLLVPLLVLAGYAIDTGNVMAARTQLQIAADAVAHSALVKREFYSESESKTAALDIAERNMPAEKFGYVIEADDIEFGEWDSTNLSFTPQSGSDDAVRVTARRLVENDNAVKTFFLKLVGFDEWSLDRSSVFVTYYPSCLREGFVAEGVVDLQSNNNFSNGFCIHSNSYVSLNSNNYFEPGTVVSMTDTDDLELPNSGFATNEGLNEALREGSWNIKIINRIANIISGLGTFDPDYLPDYITSTTTVKLTKRDVEQADLVSGRLHTYSCTGGAAFTIKNNVLVENVVIITDCDIKFESGVVLQNAVIATTGTGSKSMTASSGLQIGRNDNCAEGGDVQLVTMGSMDFPADLSIYGSQLLAVHDVSFSANAVGIQGAAIVAGGEISGTSNMNMGFCGTGMENNFMAEYFKLVL